MIASRACKPISVNEVTGGASERVALAIVSALEQRRLVPGQRLIETELALEFGVGRNAVREAIKQLAAKSLVDLSRNRSPSVRRLDLPEILEVSDVAEELFCLLARTAAGSFVRKLHGTPLTDIASRLREARASRDRASFASSRRDFYRLLLMIGGNRELRRHFATLQMQVVYAQCDIDALIDTRLEDYAEICRGVTANESKAAESAARRHVKRVRSIIQQMHLAKR